MATTTTEDFAPRVLSRPQHIVSRADLSSEAIKVLYRLHRSGYLAFLVGGSVRDLLLGREPKDFDVATNARPQEIRRLFRNSRVIGRRFRLAHIFFRGTIIEVATFRASPEPPETPDDWREGEAETAEEETASEPPPPRAEEAIYGTPAEDARRRDFTINALFYNIADFSVIDHVGGIEDLERRLIRTIGDPDERFIEDPVRMMRAMEYAVRLGFEIDGETVDAIERQKALITEASSPRLTYELLECLRSGNSAGIHAAWRKAGVFTQAFPDLPLDTDETVRVLAMVDRGQLDGREFSDPSLLGAFFLPRFLGLAEDARDGNGRIDNASLLARIRDVLDPAAASMHLSNQTIHLMQQGLFALTKMQRPPDRGRQVVKLSRQDYFKVAWDLHEFATRLGFVSEAAHQGWAKGVARLKSRQPDENAAQERPRSKTRPRRRRRRRSG